MSNYDTDIIEWSEEQAELLRSRQFDSLDIDNIIEEIISVGRQEVRSLENWLSEFLANLIRFHYLANQPSADWLDLAKKITRRKIERTPSLRARFSYECAWSDAVMALSETETDQFTKKVEDINKPQWGLEELLEGRGW